MCKFASFVLTKDKCFWLPESDSHSEIILHYGLYEAGVRGLNVVKVEITPTAQLLRWHDYHLWALTFDQDQFPEWHDPVTSEKRARASLVERAKVGFSTVDASGCADLTKLDAPNAKTVDARGCAALTKLDAPNAKYVDASGCAALTKLDAPNAKTVDASGCAALTKLDAPNAKYVYASGCAALTKLDAPNAETVDASGCAALTVKK